MGTIHLLKKLPVGGNEKSNDQDDKQPYGGYTTQKTDNQKNPGKGPASKPEASAGPPGRRRRRQRRLDISGR
jgi:hypothetical protein